MTNPQYPQPSQNPYGSQPPQGPPPPMQPPNPYAPPPNQYGPYGAQPQGPYPHGPLPPARKASGPGAVIWLAAVIVVLALAGGAAFYVLGSDDEDETCAIAAGDTLACVEPSDDADASTSPAEEPATAAGHPDAVDLTEGAAPFEPGDGYVAFTDAQDLWLPVIDIPGWNPTPESELNGASLAFDLSDETGYYAGVSCYEAADRGIETADFLDDAAVYQAITDALREIREEYAVYEQVVDPLFEHYVIDGHAVLAATTEFAWTQTADENGDPLEVDWTEPWGFVAYDRPGESSAICSYGSWDPSLDLDPLREQLLAARFAE